jgi:uncharacterized protein (DUF58 family)
MQFKWLTLGMSALCLILLATILNVSHLYYMAAILLALPGISLALGWYTLRGLEFSRELPPSAWEGEEGAIVYLVRNMTRVPRFFLSVREPYPGWIEPLDPEPMLFNVGAGDTTRVAHRLRFCKRGVYRVKACQIAAIDPLGISAFAGQVACDGELVVYPLPKEMPLLPISGAERHGLQDRTRVALRGSSVDPDGIREYVPGDSLRHIHWRQTARTGRLNVIEFEEAQTSNLVIVLDLLRGTEVGRGRETTLEDGVRMAAAMAQSAVRQGASVRLLVPMDAFEGDPPASALMVAQAGHGQQQLFFTLDALARVQAESRQAISTLVTEAVGDLLPGTTLLVLTADADGNLSSALTRYTLTGANVNVIYVDPATYPDVPRTISAAHRQNFLNALIAAGVHVYVLKHNQQDELLPEVVADVK